PQVASHQHRWGAAGSSEVYGKLLRRHRPFAVRTLGKAKRSLCRLGVRKNHLSGYLRTLLLRASKAPSFLGGGRVNWTMISFQLACQLPVSGTLVADPN